MDDASMNFGLLMEAAQAHQKVAETILEGLRRHTEGLDTVVRDEIRHTMVEELTLVKSAADEAAASLRRIGRMACVRQATLGLALGVLCACLPALTMRWRAPTPSELAELQSRRDRLAGEVTVLERRAAKLDLRTCGSNARTCIRVDRSSPSYGAKGDYYVAAGG
ncbi:MAG TPA: hypothetical protein VHV81_13615 [Steroidobacteraceae bacterium]|nr:hypothetical protein [Steroidobacteraceae bacterium]